MKPDDRIAMVLKVRSGYIAFVLNTTAQENVEDMATYLGLGCSDYSLSTWEDLDEDTSVRHWVMHYADAKRRRYQPVDKPRKFKY